MKIGNEAQADAGGLKYLENEAEITRLEAKREKEIQKAKEKVKINIADCKAANKKIMENMADWFWANAEKRDEKTKGQLTLTHVRLTERNTKDYKYPSPLTGVIAKARKLDFPRFVRTKEEVAKDIIKAEASEDQLKALGIKTVETSTVYIEEL